jgi:hypothetical protein
VRLSRLGTVGSLVNTILGKTGKRALFGRPDAAQLCNLAFAGPLPWVAEHF